MKLELLAPAKNYQSGRIAINYGADALYIGAPRFGARQAAGNSIRDIDKLVRYARFYGVKVYAALNVLILESELREAESLARELIDVGVDALIIQDPCFLRMGLEGVRFHASTQMCNTSSAKVSFLERCGFSRVILERGLSIEQIADIKSKTSLELETFIHGALCVSRSGDCFLSRSMGSRSGNRGQCAQPCRLPYLLLDKEGNMIGPQRHYLSLKDLNLTSKMGQLISSGVTSFKIEGRLKDENYIKNVVCHYRNILDGYMDSDGDLCRTSHGITRTAISADPGKSFNRSFTHWNFNGKGEGVANFDTPKSVGEQITTVKGMDGDWIVVDNARGLDKGDGLVFYTGKGAEGFNVNDVDGGRIWPNRKVRLTAGTPLYRNYDHRFEKLLTADRAVRLIPIDVILGIKEDRIFLNVTEPATGKSLEVSEKNEFPAALKEQRMRDVVESQLKKVHDGKFIVNNFTVNFGSSPVPLMPVSFINQLRREALERMTLLLEESVNALQVQSENTGVLYPFPDRDINVTNSLSRQFYVNHGIKNMPPARELAESLSGQVVMTSDYCLRKELGCCPRDRAHGKWKGEYLQNGNNRYRLQFDCEQCLMKLIKI